MNAILEYARRGIHRHENLVVKVFDSEIVKVHSAQMKILVYRLGSLGDTILALPSLYAIRSAFPAAQIVLLTNIPVSGKAAPMLEILENTGIFDGKLAYPVGTRNPKALANLALTIRKAKFDCVVHLAAARGKSKSVRDWLFFKACGIRRIVGVPWKQEDLVPERIGPGELREWEARRLARRVSGLCSVDLDAASSWDLKPSDEEKARAHNLVKETIGSAGYIVASVGTKAFTKDWTTRNWQELLTRVSQASPSLGLVMIGSPDEAERSVECMRGWTGPKVEVCGRLNPRESSVVLSNANAFLGHDSGPMHLAAAAGIPVVAIFSAHNFPGLWYPKGRGNAVLYHEVPCLGCGLVNSCPNEKRCILSITTEEVFSAYMKIAQS